MAFDAAVQGASATAYLVDWTSRAGKPQLLVGAAVSGTLKNTSSGAVRAIDGVLTVLRDGLFSWECGVGDLGTPGVYTVQFVAQDANGREALTYPEPWEVIARQ